MKRRHQQSRRKEVLFPLCSTLFPALEKPSLFLLKIAIVFFLLLLRYYTFPVLRPRFCALSNKYLSQWARLLIHSVILSFSTQIHISSPICNSPLSHLPKHRIWGCVCQSHLLPSFTWSHHVNYHQCQRAMSTSPDWSFRSLLFPLLIVSPLLPRNHNLCGRLNGWNSLAGRNSGKRNVYCSSFQTFTMHCHKYILHHDTHTHIHTPPPNHSFHESTVTLNSCDTVWYFQLYPFLFNSVLFH